MKTPPCKAKARYQHHSETTDSFTHPKWNDAWLNGVLWSEESTFQISFENQGQCDHRTKEEKNRTGMDAKLQKRASLMVWGVVVPMAWVIYMFGKAPLMLKGRSRFTYASMQHFFQ